MLITFLTGFVNELLTKVDREGIGLVNEALQGFSSEVLDHVSSRIFLVHQPLENLLLVVKIPLKIRILKKCKIEFAN